MTPTDQVEVEQECSKCGKTLDTTGFPLWCGSCRKAYQKEYRSLVKQMSETRGFAAGRAALRDEVAKYFGQFPGAPFSGEEIARWVRTL